MCTREAGNDGDDVAAVASYKIKDGASKHYTLNSKP